MLGHMQVEASAVPSELIFRIADIGYLSRRNSLAIFANFLWDQLVITFTAKGKNHFLYF